MIVMPFGRLVSGMAENKRSIPNVLRVVDRDHGCDAVAKHMREETAAKLPTRTEEDLESKGLIRELGPDFRHPDRVELRMNRRGVGIARLLPAPQQDRSMHAEIPFESRPERRRENRLVRDASFGLLGGEDDLPRAARLHKMPTKSHHREILAPYRPVRQRSDQ